MPLPNDRRLRLLIFGLLFASYAYFYEAGGWNQNSRFALVRAITDRGSLQIDPFQHCTGDRAVYLGHFFSDKAPGLSFLAVPVVAAGRRVCRTAGVDPESYTGIAALSYGATVATSGLLTALAGLCLFGLARRFGASRPGATFVALSYGLATPMWAYATLFVGHAVSAAFLVFAFAAALRLAGSADARSDLRLGLAAGAAAGWATVTEFPAAVPAAAIALLAVVLGSRHGRARAAGTAAALAFGALACAAALGLYEWACFGSPFHIPYESEQGFAAMRHGLFGISLPTLERLRGVLFGGYRGLLPLAPVLIVTPVGLALLAMERNTRPAALTAAFISTYYVLLNAGYFYWDGGWSYGPRHMSAALPFLCLGLVPAWRWLHGAGRAALGALAAYGAALSLIAVATTAQPPNEFGRPMWQFLWPSFRHWKLSLNTQDFTVGGALVRDMLAHAHHAAWNVGQRWFGLSDEASLVPLAVVYAAILIAFLWEPAVLRLRTAGGRAPHRVTTG